jgi:hypothetical protein
MSADGSDKIDDVANTIDELTTQVEELAEGSDTDADSEQVDALQKGRQEGRRSRRRARRRCRARLGCVASKHRRNPTTVHCGRSSDSSAPMECWAERAAN